jgi:hypothetical protein
MDIREQPDGLGQEPVGRLLHDFVEESKRVLVDARRLLHSEVESAKFEVRREAKKLGAPAAFAGGGGVLLHVAVLMLAFALGGLLAQAMPTWAAFLITAAVFGAAGAALLGVARKRLTAVQLKPAETIHRLEEDQRWTRELTQSARSNLRHDT